MSSGMIYKEHGRWYHADTCGPLVEAARRGQVRLQALARGTYPGFPLPRTALPGLCTVGFWDAKGQGTWGLEWHRNEGIELTFLETGTLGFAIRDRSFRLQPGDMTVTRPWQEHRVGLPTVGPCRLHWVILDVKVRRPNQHWNWPRWLVLTRSDLQELTTMLRHNERPVWKATSEIKRCFQQIARTVESNRSSSQISRLTAYLNEILVMTLEMMRGRHMRLDETLSSSRHTVELFLADLRQHPSMLAHLWTLPEMAAQCGLGPTYFTHYCRQIANLTPLQYLAQCRVDHAAGLLQTTSRSIIEIALECGFSSSQYFATVFRRLRGVNPRQFRRNIPTTNDPEPKPS